MKRYHILLFSFLTVFGACKQVEEKNQKPNIVFILADDLGYMDIQEYAHKTLGVDKDSMFYETSHLDRLIQKGVAFQQAYANQLCSLTRASLLTGKYSARLGCCVHENKRDTAMWFFFSECIVFYIKDSEAILHHLFCNYSFINVIF